MGTEKLLRSDNPKIPRIDELGRTWLEHKVKTSAEGASMIEERHRLRLIAFIRKGADFFQTSLLARHIMKKSLVIEDYQYLRGYAEQQEEAEKHVMLVYPRYATNQITGLEQVAYVRVIVKLKEIFKYLYNVLPVMPNVCDRIVISRKYWDGIGNPGNLIQELRHCGKIHVIKMIENMLDQFRAEIRKSKNNKIETFPMKKPK